MALTKQNININFSQGLDTKTDPFQVQPGKFLSLQNSVFDKAGALTKRNGFGKLTTLPDSTTDFLTTFNGNLTAIGESLEAYNASNQIWVNKGAVKSISLDTLPLIRSNTNQSQVDAAVALNGLVCTVYTDQNTSSLGSAVYKYAIADSITGQNIVAPTAIPVSSGTVTGSPRVFVVGSYFFIVFTNVITATSHLQYIAISTSNPTSVTSAADIASAYISAPTLSWDAVVSGSRLYIAYNTLTGGQSIRVTYVSTSFTVATPVTFAGEIATIMSMTVDNSNPSSPTIWASYYDLVSTAGKALAIDPSLNTVLAPTTTITATTVLNLACTAQNGVLSFLYEVANSYTYDGAIPTNYIRSNTLNVSGTLGTSAVLVRSVGLASKSFLYNAIPYVLATYSSTYQPTDFLINALTGKVIAKLAYQNAGGYLTLGLPGVTITGAVASIPYRVKDLIIAANKEQNADSSAPVYTQTGLNLASFDFETTSQASEIGHNLNITGGYVSMYDGYTLSEQNFFLYPDSVEATWSATGGAIHAQPDGATNADAYFYQVTYEWSDNQGNIFRSAPSLPIAVTTTSNGTTGSITVNVPTLRLTYKTSNPVKIVIYRWSVAQQTYYQVTSITTPTLNSTSVDYITYVDTLADASIIGNSILYTTGGVIENTSPPATDSMTLFNNRLWLVDSENRNLLWFSKQVIDATPVEMSDLLTLYVAPTTGSEGSTGPITAIAPMDDKLIIFKENALGYISGIGPDNTGSNNQYSDFTLINSVVGCTIDQSIVFTPTGLMFQSNKGIWLLGRDLSTQYIGSPVESYTTGATVLSAVNIPGTNQVRFTLDTGITLMYDYFYGQWGTFNNVPAISSTVYENLHTYVNSVGLVFQETLGVYLDNTSPVLMSFSTSWLNLAGVQGYERFYQMYLLGLYKSPFKLNVQVAYNYNPSAAQSTIVTPDNPGLPWGGDALWGSAQLWGGNSNVFEARVFPQIQKCESFNITVTELFDSTIGQAAGAGLTLSGLNLVVGIKRGYRTSTAGKSFG